MIQLVFLILFGILGSRIQTSSSVRDGQKMAVTSFIGASVATHGLKKVI